MAALRARLDALDAQWLGVLAERFAVTAEVSALKASGLRPRRAPAREAAHGGRFDAVAAARGVPPALARAILAHIQAQVVADHGAYRAEQDQENG